MTERGSPQGLTGDPPLRALLERAAARSLAYLSELDSRPVFPDAGSVERLRTLEQPLPDHPSEPDDVLAILDAVGSPATVATAGPRYFGFVTGGALPATVAASWLATAWDQNGFSAISSPTTAALERITVRWLVDLLGLPQGTGAGLVTGATMANFTALTAARHAVLARAGWDVESRGLFGAPEITVVVGEEVHVSLLKALSLLGLGRDRVVRVPVDDQGRMQVDGLPPLSPGTVLCIQAGNVNTGAFDPASGLCTLARKAGAWVHVDGAFGLWAAAAPARRPLTAGVADADSWALDAHKWLNVPYDSGIGFCREPAHLAAAMAMSAAYLADQEHREPHHYTPEMSRRARVVELWAALLTLGRSGVADLVERCCRHAARFAEGLAGAGYRILNRVDLNQVLVSFGDPDLTRRVIAAVQGDGTCWCGGTVWQGQTAMRISVSSWATTEADVERSLAAMLRIAERERERSADRHPGAPFPNR